MVGQIGDGQCKSVSRPRTKEEAGGIIASIIYCVRPAKAAWGREGSVLSDLPSVRLPWWCQIGWWGSGGAAVPLFLDGQTDTMGNNEALRRRSAQNAGHIWFRTTYISHNTSMARVDNSFPWERTYCRQVYDCGEVRLGYFNVSPRRHRGPGVDIPLSAKPNNCMQAHLVGGNSSRLRVCPLVSFPVLLTHFLSKRETTLRGRLSL